MEQIETKNHILTLIEEQMRDIPEDAGLLAVFYWDIGEVAFENDAAEQVKEVIKSALPERAKVLIIPRKGGPTQFKLYSFVSKEEL